MALWGTLMPRRPASLGLGQRRGAAMRPRCLRCKPRRNACGSRFQHRTMAKLATWSVPQGTASRPGVAQSANSDGYSECMAMWKPSNTGMSHDEWSKTCDRARLTPK